LRAGGFGWGHAKEALFELLDTQLTPLRERYLELRADEAAVDAILDEGAERAREVASGTIKRVRRAVGIQ
jgi:tryptophanyl-tRNA synthetase